MNKINKVLLILAILLFAVSPAIAGRINNNQLFTLGNADRTYDYQGTVITCYLGQLFPGQPVYWCMYPNMAMQKSWMVWQSNDMNKYYTAGPTTTYTLTAKGRLN